MPLVVTESIVNAVLRNVKLAALFTLIRPTMVLPVLSKVTSAACTVNWLVLAACTLEFATWVRLPPEVLMLNAPELSTLPSTMLALPLMCVAPPAVKVLSASMRKALEPVWVVVPTMVNAVAAVAVAFTIDTPSIPSWLARPAPVRLTLLPVDAILASLRLMPRLKEVLPPVPAEPVPFKFTVPDPVMALLITAMPLFDEPLPNALPALSERPTKVTAAPVIDVVAVSPNNKTPMA